MFVLNAGPNEYFRHLDPDVMLLFDEELILQYPLPPEKKGRALGLLEFKYDDKSCGREVGVKLILSFPFTDSSWKT